MRHMPPSPLTLVPRFGSERRTRTRTSIDFSPRYRFYHSMYAACGTVALKKYCDYYYMSQTMNERRVVFTSRR